jgi:anti-anti-sigma factor
MCRGPAGGPPMADEKGDVPCRVELQSRGRTCILVVSGRLTAASIAALEAQVDQLGCLPCDDVVVDAAGLTALDPVGANVLLGLFHYVNGRGGTLRISGARGSIARTLRQYAVEYAETDVALTEAIDESAGESDTEGLTDLDDGQTLLA